MTPARMAWQGGAFLPENIQTALLGPGAPFEIVSESIRGVQHQVFRTTPRSMREAIGRTVARQPDATFIVAPHKSWTFSEFIGDVESVSRALIEQYAIRKGDRVAIVAANSAEYAVLQWAVLSVGAIVTSLNGWWNGPELTHGIALTAPSLVLGDEQRLARLEPGSVPDGVPVIELEPFVDAAIASGADGRSWFVDTDPDDAAVILFTSGTTGRAKGATLTHRNIIHFGMANMLSGAIGMMMAAPAPGASGVPSSAGFQPASIVASPMFHVSGLTATLQVGPMMGTKLVFPKPGRWDPLEMLQITHDQRVSAWSGVPTQFWRLLRHERFAEFDVSCVRSAGGGGATFSPELTRTMAELIPNAIIGNGYGMSETAGMGTRIGSPMIAQFPDSVGMANPTVEVEIRTDDGSPLPEGEVGEIHMRCAAVFKGYWNNPEATAAAIDADGWYRTGDFGRISGGMLYLESRRRDLIIRGGENIYPIEIENALVEHPEIDDAAVIGVEHEELGHEPKAFVVLSAGSTLTPADVQAFAAQRLARFKVPAHVEIRAALPYTETGKVLKHILEAEERGDSVEDSTTYGKPVQPPPTR